MDLVFDVLKVIMGAILLLVGLGLRKAYKSSGMSLRIFGDRYFAPGYKLRRFFLFLFGYLFILLSIYIFYRVIFV